MILCHLGRMDAAWRVGVAAAVVVTMLAAAPNASGHAVAGKVLSLQQPDGSAVQVRAWGDEYESVLESLDGYTLARDPASEWLCYARLSQDGSGLVSSGVAVGQADPAGLGLAKHLRVAAASGQGQRATYRASRPTANVVVSGQPKQIVSGKVKGICVLIDFPDVRGTVSPSEIDHLLNQAGYRNGGNNGSLRDYYYDVSGGQLTLEHYVATTYYTAPRKKSYYESATYEQVDELVAQALRSMDGGLDFSQFDANHDGYIDSIICICAGAGTGGLWPHGGQGTSFSADGVQGYGNIVIDMPGFTPMLQTVCHEIGHSVCWWPDLYDRDGGGAGVGFYSVMGISLDTNNLNPPRPCAVFRDMAGWTDSRNLSGTQEDVSAMAGDTIVYKCASPRSELEYFMVENRQQSGRDTGISSSGLAIWHVDLTMDSNDYQQGTSGQHYMVSLEQADGQRHLEKGDPVAPGDDLYDGADMAFGAATNPNSHWWNGAASGVTIYKISDSADTMTFSFSTTAVDPALFPAGNSSAAITCKPCCGAGAAQIFPVIFLQLLGLKLLGRRQ